MRVLVVGAGTMGHGIAEVAALAGHSVDVVDVSQEVLESARSKIEWSLKKLEAKGEVKSAAQILERIKTTTDLVGCSKNADFVVEAVVENSEVKRVVFKTLDENTRFDVILSTNTSTIPISEIASATNRPGRVIGLHFFNPPALISS
ncbi:MAG: 3-hydroxyacyl-CoA dehydrogenase NAD-binding domain-containing protein [Thermoprotei archaeon]